MENNEDHAWTLNSREKCLLVGTCSQTLAINCFKNKSDMLKCKCMLVVSLNTLLYHISLLGFENKI